MNFPVSDTFEMEGPELGDLSDTPETTEYTIAFQFVRVVDKKWGADADGNRGVRREWEEDIEFQILFDWVDITEKVKMFQPEFYEEVSKEVATRIHDYDFSE